jgi:uncharacterized protein with PQ loop repeat
MNLGFDHLNLRKRMYENLEPYPHPNHGKRNYDKFMIVVGSLAPLAVLPQVIQLYVHHDASGLSMLTWSLLASINALWAVYGIIHKERPLIIANTGLAILDFLIVAGILLYR